MMFLFFSLSFPKFVVREDYDLYVTGWGFNNIRVSQNYKDVYFYFDKKGFYLWWGSCAINHLLFLSSWLFYFTSPYKVIITMSLFTPQEPVLHRGPSLTVGMICFYIYWLVPVFLGSKVSYRKYQVLFTFKTMD